jgi:outer membrane protein assembly factor BamB
MRCAGASILVAFVALATDISRATHAQQSVIIPTVSDSPTAAELLLRADEQAASNPGESARLAAELLRDLADKLVQTKQPGVYRGVADQVAALLAAHPAVLERYRSEVSAQAREWLAEGRLVEVAMQFAATDAGLQAMLRLAGRALQEARADEATAWLRRASMHPSAALDPAPRHALEALAAWTEGDRTAWVASAAELAAVPGVAPSLVEAIRSMGEPPVREQRTVLSDGAPDIAAQVPAMPWIEAWTAPLMWSPASIRNKGTVPIDGISGRDNTGRAARSLLHTVVPIIDRGELIVADGRVVSCFDLLTHTLRWQAMLAIDQAARSADTMLTPCVVDAERVHSVVSVGELGGATSSRVVAVRRSDGRLLWQRSLEDPDGFHPGGLRVAGSIALAGDVLAVPCLRQNGRLELACWIMGLDAEDGSTRWAVPLGAANGLLPEFGSLTMIRGGMGAVAHRGLVLVGTMVGTAACIEAPTGAVRWIARHELARTRQSPLQESWEASVPVVDGDAAWFLHADARAVTGRALADGAVIHSQPLGQGEPLGGAQYLVGASGTIVGVSTSGALSAVRAADPAAPLWQLPAASTEPLVGRAVLARSADRSVIMLPRVSRVDVHDLASGALIGSMPVRRSGTIGVGDERVAIVSEMNLEVWGQDDRIVADLMALVDRGTATDAEIALAESALKRGDMRRALDMARRALARLDAVEERDDVPAARGRVVDVLLEIVRRSPDGTDAVDVLRQSALLPSQSLRVALALVERHASRSEWLDAARTLANAAPALDGDALVEHGGARVRTSQVLSVAMQRLVVQAHAARSNAIEQAADEAVRQRGSATAEAIARVWRGTMASIRAALESSERARADDRLDDADRCAQRAALITLERADAGLPIDAALVNRVAASVIDVGADDLLAVKTLRRLHRMAPSAAAFTALAANEPWIIVPRLARVDDAPRKGQRAIQFSASLPAINAFARQQSTPGRGVLVVNQQLVGIKGTTLAPEWAIEIEDPAPVIVRMLPTMTVLERTMALPGRLRGLDPVTGTVSWSIEDLGLLLGPVQPIPGWRDDENVLSRRGQFDVLPLGDGTVAVRRDGSCARIAADGRVRWTSGRSLPIVEHVQTALGGVALVGPSLSSDPALTLVSSTTGQERGQVHLEGMAQVDAVESTLCGFVITRGLASTLVEDTEAGPRILWERMSPPGATRRMPPIVLNEAMFMGQPTDGSFRLDLDDGSRTALDWDGGEAGAWSPLLELDDGLLFAKSNRVVLAQASGRIVGSAWFAPLSSPQMAIACDGGVIVQVLEMTDVPEIQSDTTFVLLEPSQGLRLVRSVARLVVPVSWRRSLLLDGWMLQFGEDQCIAIPVGSS